MNARKVALLAGFVLSLVSGWAATQQVDRLTDLDVGAGGLACLGTCEEGRGFTRVVASTVTGTIEGPQDWTIGARNAMLGDHVEHGGMTMSHAAAPWTDLDRVVAAAYPLGIAPPVLVAPPVNGDWTVTSDAANRPLRTRITIDGRTGALSSRRDFAERHWLDRIVGYGIAAHEGALFGLPNQLLGTFTALLLNPFLVDRPSPRFPNIVQDAAIPAKQAA